MNNPDPLIHSSAAPSSDPPSSVPADQITIVSAVDSGGRARTGPVAPPRIEGYEIHGEIHRGGQGVVYRATQLGTKRQVALKVLLEGPFASEHARRRFEREVELAASLRHPDIVTILDSGVSHGRYFFAMEFIDGQRLDQFLDQARPPLKQTIQLLSQICAAIHFAHQRGVIHRDLKPSNILVDSEGRPRILDFGLAKTTLTTRDPNETAVAMLSTTGQILGTLAYMSPEQAAGSDDLDVRSDVYSLGVVFYESLLGRTPYSISGPLGEVLNRIATSDPTPPRAMKSSSRYGPLIDDELETILLKALEKDRARRYQSAGELGRDLQHYLMGEPIEAKRASGLYVLRKTLKRYRIQAAAAGIVLLTLIGALAMFVVLYRRENKLHQEAQRLQTLADERAGRAQKAEEAQRDALGKEKRATAEATRSAEDLRRALALQTIQRGDLARARGDLGEARESYWQAYLAGPDNAAAIWALRQYYLESGDQGALQLAFHCEGPAAISSDGAVVAICDSDESMRVCSTADGRMLAWLPLPGRPSCLVIDQDKRLIAGGAGWLGLWNPVDYAQPRIIRWSEVAPPTGIAANESGDILLVLLDREIRSVRLDSREIQDSGQLDGFVTGPVMATRRGILMVPCDKGVEMVWTTADGTLGKLLRWAGSKPAKYVCLEDARFRVLADAVYEIGVQPVLAADYRPVLRPEGDFVMMDCTQGGDIALAAADGRVAVYQDGKPVFDQHLADEPPVAMKLVDGGTTLMTLTPHGVLTRWSWSAAQQGRQLVYSRPVSTWAISEDGSTAFLMQPNGETVSFRPGAAEPIRRVVEGSSMSAFAGGREVESRLRVSANGSIAVIQTGNSLYATFSGAATAKIPVSEAEVQSVRDFSLSADGKTLAVLVESQKGDEQTLLIRALSPETVARPSGQNDPRARNIKLQGGHVRGVSFFGNGTDLLIWRLSGELLQLSPADMQESKSPAEVWASVDSPPYRVAFDREAARMAAACDDGILRVLSLLDTSELASINVGQQIYGLSFDPSGDVLLVRTAEGLALFELAHGQRVAHWEMPNIGTRCLAGWFGPSDGVLISDTAGVYEIDYGSVDDLIRQQRSFAVQAQISRSLQDAGRDDRWAMIQQLWRDDAAAGGAAEVNLLQILLQRPRIPVPAEWFSHACENAGPIEHRLLGFAAHRGGRFEWSQRALSAAVAKSEALLDAATVFRLAEDSYLLGAPKQAANEFLRVAELSDAEIAPAMRLELETIAALVSAERKGQAQQMVEAIDERPQPTGPELIQFTAVKAIAQSLVGMSTETEISAGVKGTIFLISAESPLYVDDIEFFAGEMARLSGNLPEARAHYRRCVDMARDPWPQSWARVRLRQLDPAAAQ